MAGLDAQQSNLDRTSMLPLTIAPVRRPASPAGPIAKPTTTGATTASRPCAAQGEQ